MKNLKHLLSFMLIGSVLVSCSDNDDGDTIEELEKVEITLTASDIEDARDNFIDIVHTSYELTFNATLEMQTAITAFTNNPNAQTLEAAKTEWLVARDLYGQTEVYRGEWGPVDAETEESWGIANEGLMNAWPLDEGYIDYVKDANDYAGPGDGGIIASGEEITADNLEALNEANGDKNISTGWHAIEFLLWGQDETAPSLNQAGNRPFTDYTTLVNADRRKEYLNVVTQMLVDDLEKLVDTWANGGTYNTVFKALSVEEALTNMATGPYFLASEELSNERMLASATSDGGINQSGQEDEHSCFADNTHRDVFTNALGIQNVLLGEFADGNIEDQDASLYGLIKDVDPAQAQKLKQAVQAAMYAMVVIDNKYNAGEHYDYLITLESETNPGPVIDGYNALKTLGEVINESLQKLGIYLI